ncbi:MAG: cox cluster protein [Natronomonas sp.]
MSERIFDKETLLDLTVNVIPLGILIFFIAAFVLINPFPDSLTQAAKQYAIVGLTAIALVILTYYAGKAISTAEKNTEEFIPAGYSRADAERGPPIHGHDEETEDEADADSETPEPAS